MYHVMYIRHLLRFVYLQLQTINFAHFAAPLIELAIRPSGPNRVWTCSERRSDVSCRPQVRGYQAPDFAGTLRTMATTTGRHWLVDAIITEFFDYRTSRQIRVQVWQIGLGHRMLQLAIVIGIFVDLIRNNGWAYKEVPTGSVNAWEDGGRVGFASALQAAAPGQFFYCSNTSYDFVYSASFQYIQPACRTLQPEEVVTKGTGSIAFTTSLIETVEHGWRCNATDARSQAKRDACDALGVSYTTGSTPGQCLCSSSETYFVRGVEKMVIAFEHMFYGTSFVDDLHEVSNIPGRSDASCRAHSECPTSTGEWCTDHPLKTKVKDSSVEWEAHSPISMPLEWYIEQAHASLDEPNEAVRADRRGVTETVSGPCARFPQFRITGMRLNAKLVYSNLDEVSGLARFGGTNRAVTATLEVTRENIGWAGTGAETYYPEAPTRETDGVETFEKLMRYKQGVVIEFVPSGFLYTLDSMFLLGRVVAALVLLNVAATICDLIAFSVLPDGLSTVLANKRAERISKKNAFAQLGLRAAIATNWFRQLDGSNKGYLELADLVAVFGQIDQVDKENGLLIARTIMRSCDADNDGRISFTEFMSCFESSDTLDFDEYCGLVHTTAKKFEVTELEKMRASVAYDMVAAGIDLDAPVEEGAERESSEVLDEASVSVKMAEASSRSPASAGQPARLADSVTAGIAKFFGAFVAPPTATTAVVKTSTKVPRTPKPTAPPPIKVTCFACNRPFGAPHGANFAACPFCAQTNKVSGPSRTGAVPAAAAMARGEPQSVMTKSATTSSAPNEDQDI